MQIKTCTKCCKPKDINLFPSDSSKKDKHSSICKKCRSEYQVEWQKRNKEKFNGYQRKYKAANKEKIREWDNRYHAKWRKLNPERYQANYHKAKCKGYGVTVEWYEEQLEKQNGSCAICSGKCKSGRRLAIDHDHVSGRVRGLLCSDCNGALARLDSVEGWAFKAVDYLKQYR